jgi:hypothetical protein
LGSSSSIASSTSSCCLHPPPGGAGWQFSKVALVLHCQPTPGSPQPNSDRVSSS